MDLKRILLIQLRQLGDILLTTPAIRAVRQAYPNAQIDFLSHRMGQLILGQNPDINQLWVYHEKDSLIQQFKLYQSLKNQKYDCVIDFMYNPRSALMTWFTKAPHRIAFHSRRQWAYNRLVPAPKETDYIVREKFRLIREINVIPKDESLVLPWTDQDAAIVASFERQHSEFAMAPLRVAISATHRREERQWPIERYAQIADRIQNEWGASVVWIWGPGEEKLVESGMSFCSRPMLKSPQTTFSQLSALLANCDLFIGNSNGPSHVAVAVNTCSLQLHGPTLAKAWCPLNERHIGIQAVAMGAITVDEVWRKLRSLKPEVEKKAKLRRDNGARINWKMRVASEMS